MSPLTSRLLQPAPVQQRRLRVARTHGHKVSREQPEDVEGRAANGQGQKVGPDTRPRSLKRARPPRPSISNSVRANIYHLCSPPTRLKFLSSLQNCIARTLNRRSSPHVLNFEHVPEILFISFYFRVSVRMIRTIIHGIIVMITVCWETPTPPE